MKSIPSEVLDQIFSFLSQEDHMECMLVCHLWKDVIEQLSLFKTLCVYSTYSSDKFIKKIQENPDIGSHVEQLTFYTYHATGANLSKFLEKLPNVRTLNCHFPEPKLIFIEDSAKISWNKSIESISEKKSDSITIHILTTGICPNLTVLKVSDYDRKVIPLLKNAPALKSLTLEYGSISFRDINAIHEFSPYLTTLSLSNCLIIEHINEDIVPINSVTEISLVMNGLMNEEEHGLLRFITIKYPKLQKITYIVSAMIARSNREFEILIQLGWVPLLQSLGPHFKISKASNLPHIYDIQKFIEILDTYHCEIENFPLSDVILDTALPKYLQSRQIQYIRILSLINVNCKTFNWLKDLVVLDSLIIRSFDTHCDLTSFVENAPPTLSSLYIYEAILSAKTITNKQLNLKNITLIQTQLPSAFDCFISRHFSLLENLTLENCDFYVKRFNMSLIDLHTFCFVDTIKRDTITVLVQASCNFERRLYSTRSPKYYVTFKHPSLYHDNLEYPPVKSRPANEMETSVDFSLYCNSVRKVALCR